MTYRRTRTGSLKDIVKSAKKFVERHTHEVPTGPHTDVTRRKINPSFKKRITGVGLPRKTPDEVIKTITGVGAGTKGGFGAVKRKPKKSRNF